VDDIDIRALRTHEELQACVRLQHETWGEGFLDDVPPSILIVAQRLGGVAAGAFDADDRLLGFVFGLTGVERRRIVHWSDMLAVRPEQRNSGLGQRLKEYQRREALAAGATLMYWTYDPLVQRNAHLNLTRLGARVAEYVENMYGEKTGSVLHRGLGTDRMIVAWELDDESAVARATPRGSLAAIAFAGAAATEALTLNRIVSTGEGHAAPFEPPASPPALARIVIPTDIAAIQAMSLDEAAAWRQSTRPAFLWALSHGYRITGFARGEDELYGSYVLQRAAT
jgi:predicted GNAT superfamily acetyltransferase